MAQNPILALVTPIIGNKKVMFPIPKHSDENIVLFKPGSNKYNDKIILYKT